MARNKPRAEVIKIKTNKQNNTKNKRNKEFFEKINNIDKPLAKLTKRQREDTQINETRYEKEDMKTDTEEVQRIIRTCFESLQI